MTTEMKELSNRIVIVINTFVHLMQKKANISRHIL